eukprot:4978087-Amphidinium_carterae.1
MMIVAISKIINKNNQTSPAPQSANSLWRLSPWSVAYRITAPTQRQREGGTCLKSLLDSSLNE